MIKLFLFLFLFFSLQVIYPQNIPAAYFLTIPNNAQSQGIGDIGTVATEKNTASALTYNPALLAGNKAQFGGNFSYLPYLRALVPDIYFANAGLYYCPDQNNGFSYNLTYYSQGKMDFGTMVPVKIYNFYQSFRYARAISEKFSIGAGLKHINYILPMPMERTNEFAGDIGIKYLNNIVLTGQSDLRINIGANLNNFGPKIIHDLYWNPPFYMEGFLPSSLEIGFMAGILRNVKENKKISLDIAYQVQKQLIPSEYTPGVSALQGMVISFHDSPEGLNGELKELINQFGMEGTYETKNISITARGGAFFEKSNFRNISFIMLGAGVAIKNYTLDIAKTIPLYHKWIPVDNTLYFTFGKKWLL